MMSDFFLSSLLLILLASHFSPGSSEATTTPLRNLTSKLLTSEQIACNFIKHSTLSVCRTIRRVTNATGEIPSKIGLLTKLTHVSLKANGVLPTTIGKLTKLKHLDCGASVFEGTIPSEIGRLTLLTHLTLRQFVDGKKLPASIGKLTQLQYLDLSNNFFFNSKLPSLQIAKLKQLRHLNLRGSIFPENNVTAYVGKLTRLTSLDLRLCVKPSLVSSARARK
jgi:Leucine-rich repeat (LRR) protein